MYVVDPGTVSVLEGEQDSKSEDGHLLARNFPSAASLRPETNPAGKYKVVWQRAFAKIKGKISMSSLGKDILLFGASTLTQRTVHDMRPGENYLTKLVQRTVIVGKPAEALGWLFRPKSTFKTIWTGVFLVLMIYTAFLMPYRLAFTSDDGQDLWYTLDLVVAGLFFLDVLITLNSAIVTEGSGLITSRRSIFLIYLKSWLILDVVSCIPFSAFDSTTLSADNNKGQFNSMLRFAKLPRLYRLLRLARVLKMMHNYNQWRWFDKLQEFLSLKQSVMRMILFLLTVLLALHLMACFWYFTAVLEGLTPETWAGRMKLEDASQIQQYTTSMYWAITTLATVGYGDVTPTTTIERIVVIMWMIFGVCFFSFTISSLSSMLNSIDTRDSLLYEKLAAIDEFAEESRLSKDLRLRLRHALRYSTQQTGFSSQVKRGIFIELPRELRFEVALAMHHGAGKDIPFFAERDQAFVAAVVPFLNSLETKCGTPVYKKGEYADEIYFIAKGRCVYMFRDLVMKKMQQGSYFGETEVLQGIPRLYTILASADTDLLSMNRELLAVIESDFPMVYEEVRQISQIRSQLNEKTVARFQQLFGAEHEKVKVVTFKEEGKSDSSEPLDPPEFSPFDAFRNSEERLNALEGNINDIKASVQLITVHLLADRIGRAKSEATKSSDA